MIPKPTYETNLIFANANPMTKLVGSDAAALKPIESFYIAK